MLSGDNGILQRATDAKTRTERASVIEQARTDVLGYQAENKGGDLDKSQLKSVLDKYFDEVPDLTDMEKDTILNTELHTLSTFGTHTIKVSEIYNGNLSGTSKVKVATLFEDKAGDEDGATEGKIHIGDYVNYNPISSGDTGTEIKYKYPSSNNNTGITEAIAAGKVTGFSDSSQDFTTKSDLKWQVIGIDGDNILITTEEPIIPDNPVSVQEQMGPSYYVTKTGYGVYGAKAYVNISSKSGERNEIDNISQIYKYGKGADQNKARGISIEDVNAVTGVTADGVTLAPSGIYTAPTGYEYGTTLTDFKKGESSGWTPEAWLSASSTDRTDATKSPGISEKITGYYYQGSNASLKTASSNIRNNLIFGESSNLKSYYLASHAYYGNSGGGGFGAGHVLSGVVRSYGNHFYSYGMESREVSGVRPVVYLSANVELTAVGTTNNITTWNIN